MKKLFTYFLALVCTSSLFASDTQVDGIWYDFDSSTKTASVTYRGRYSSAYKQEYTDSIVIPKTVTYERTTYSVTTIGDYAFEDCSGLTSVTIPNSVTTIEKGAFYNCTSLTSVTIPNSVTSIGGSAFYNCSSLTSIIIPNSVTTIERSVFSGCTGLTSVIIGDSVTTIGERAFQSCTSLTSITIGKSVTEIGKYAFEDCNGLKEVYIIDLAAWCKISFYDVYANPLRFAYTLYLNNQLVTDLVIPNCITEIKDYAFIYCYGLTSVTIPNSVTTIGSSAFSGCSGLTSVTIPNSVTTIGDHAFNKVNNIVYDGTATGSPWSAKCVNGYVEGYLVYSDATKTTLRGCSSAAREIVIPNSVTTIGDYAFEDCSGLTSVTIPNSVTTIEKGAFYNCTSLTSVTIPNSVTTIGKEAFSWCTGLTSITIPNFITTIEESAFSYCRGLTSVSIPNSVTTIGEQAFTDCSSLTSVTIPNSVTTIGSQAFSYCRGLTSVTIPNSVTTIMRSVFRSCSGLTSITIPNSVTSIGQCAFEGCTGLTSVTIPNSVTTIGSQAFEKCYSLTYVTISNSVTRIGSYAFRECSSLTSVTIGNSVTTIGYEAFDDCLGLTSITCLTMTPPECDDYVFRDISQDAKVYVPASALADYQNAETWKDMQLFPIAADVAPMEDDNPIITPSDQDVTITWPITDGTDTYTLTITKNGETVCVLTFNTNGQLTNIAFAAPGHNGARQAPAATLTAQGYQFTVTGLNPGTAYNYSVTATDAGGKTLAEHKGNFSTTGGTGFESVHDAQPTMHKVLRNGQLLIETNNATYTPMGQKVK